MEANGGGDVSARIQEPRGRGRKRRREIRVSESTATKISHARTTEKPVSGAAGRCNGWRPVSVALHLDGWAKCTPAGPAHWWPRRGRQLNGRNGRVADGRARPWRRYPHRHGWLSGGAPEIRSFRRRLSHSRPPTRRQHVRGRSLPRQRSRRVLAEERSLSLTLSLSLNLHISLHVHNYIKMVIHNCMTHRGAGNFFIIIHIFCKSIIIPMQGQRS